MFIAAISMTVADGTNQILPTENVIHKQNGVVFRYKKEEIMKSVVRWVDLESVVLRDVGLTQNEMNLLVFLLIWILAYEYVYTYTGLSVDTL